MATVMAEVSAEVGASAAVAYGILSDYRAGHPAILPPRYFTGLHVEQGGQGAGTVIRFGMKFMGFTREARAEVAEPEPGRVLTETVQDTRGTTTTFTVDPVAADRARVTISTAWTTRGIAGLVDRLLAPRMLQRIYLEELERLDQVARTREPA